MPQKLYGSICLSDLVEKAKSGHSAFSKSEKNGKIYVNIQQWINDEKNSLGFDSSLLLSSKKEKKDEEGKVYIGNLKISEYSGAPITSGDLEFDLPGATAVATTANIVDDLPF